MGVPGVLGWGSYSVIQFRTETEPLYDTTMNLLVWSRTMSPRASVAATLGEILIVTLLAVPVAVECIYEGAVGCDIAGLEQRAPVSSALDFLADGVFVVTKRRG
jgi:hypothetical protein